MIIAIAAVALVAAAEEDDKDRPQNRPVGERQFAGEVDVTVANLEVYIRDRNGQPVEGLTAADFKIIQDGVEMPISNFAVLTPEIFSAQIQASETGDGFAQGQAQHPPAIQPAYVVLHFDNENLNPLDRNRVMVRVKTFVEEILAAPVYVMVVSSRRSPQIRQTFTDDPDMVVRALEHVAKESGARLIRDRERRRIFADMEEWATDPRTFDPAYLNTIEVRIFKTQVQQQILAYTEEQHGALKDTLASMHQVVQLISGIEGRRSIIYVSSGLPMTPGLGLLHEYAAIFHDNTIYTRIGQRDYSQEFHGLADAANRQGISLYTIDASGLRPLEGFGADGRYTPESAASWVDMSNIQEPLRFMADATGGVAVFNTNDVTDGLRLIRDDFLSYYSIGFSITSNGKDATHRIDVDLPRHPEYEVRYRKWIIDKSLETRVRERVLQALVRDIKHNPLDLQLTFGEPAPITGKRWEVPIRLSIPINSLALEVESGDLVGTIELFFCVRDALGRKSPTRRREYEVRVPSAQFDPNQVRRYAITVQMVFREQRHTVAVGLVDRVNHQTSYARALLSVP